MSKRKWLVAGETVVLLCGVVAAMWLIGAGQGSTEAKGGKPTAKLGPVVVHLEIVAREASDGVRVLLRVENTGKEPVPYLDWLNRPAENRPNAAQFTAWLFADGVAVKVGDSMADFPKEITSRMPRTVRLHFPKVPADARELELVLPGATVGQKGEMRMRLELPTTRTPPAPRSTSNERLEAAGPGTS